MRTGTVDEYGNMLTSSGMGTTSPKTFVGGLSVNDDTADSGMFNMGHQGGLNLYAYPTNPVNAVDPAGLSPIIWFIKGANGTWKMLGKGQRGKQLAARRMRNPPGVNLKLEGCSKNAREAEAVDLGKKVFGKDNVKIDRPHKNDPFSIGDHVQPKNRRKTPTHIGWNYGHIYFSGALMLPLVNFGVNNFGDNALGRTFDALSPAGDIEFAVGIAEDKVAEIGANLGTCYQENEPEINAWLIQQAIEGGYLFGVDLRPGPFGPRLEHLNDLAY